MHTANSRACALMTRSQPRARLSSRRASVSLLLPAACPDEHAAEIAALPAASRTLQHAPLSVHLFCERVRAPAALRSGRGYRRCLSRTRRRGRHANSADARAIADAADARARANTTDMRTCADAAAAARSDARVGLQKWLHHDAHSANAAAADHIHDLGCALVTADVTPTKVFALNDGADAAARPRATAQHHTMPTLAFKKLAARDATVTDAERAAAATTAADVRAVATTAAAADE